MLPLKIGFLFFRPRRTFELIEEKCEVTKGIAWMVFCFASMSVITSFIGSRRFDAFYFAFSSLTLLPSWLLSTHLLLIVSKKFGGTVEYPKFIEANAVSVTLYIVSMLIVTPLSYESAGHFGSIIYLPLGILAIWFIAVGLTMLKVLVKLSTRRSILAYVVSSILFWVLYGISFNAYWYHA